MSCWIYKHTLKSDILKIVFLETLWFLLPFFLEVSTQHHLPNILIDKS